MRFPINVTSKTDLRSLEAARYRRLYKTGQWARTRKAQLSRQPLCEWCLPKGRVAPATVCHHDDPKQKASAATFYLGPFTSLCAPCHDSTAQQIEVRGYSTEIGVDGFPTDVNHPANR